MSCDAAVVLDPKDPADAVWFKWDFSVWLQPGELLDTAVPPVMATSPAGLFVGSGTFASGATAVVAFVSAGVSGVYNSVSCQCQTTFGETVRRSIKFLVESL